MDSLEELETMDRPRGIVAKANLYAADKVELSDVIRRARGYSDDVAAALIKDAQFRYSQHFDDFIAGAHAAQELSKQECDCTLTGSWGEGSFRCKHGNVKAAPNQETPVFAESRMRIDERGELQPILRKGGGHDDSQDK